MGYKRYYVYLLTNRHKTVLYTGVTNDLPRRVWQHKRHAIAGFTAKYNCEYLVHFEEYDEVNDAIAREKQIIRMDSIEEECPREFDQSRMERSSCGMVRSFAVYAAQDDTDLRGSG